LKPSSDTLPLNGQVRALLVGVILDVLDDRTLANSGLNSLAEAALDLVALPRRNVDFLEGLGTGLGICEEDVEGHSEAEDTEDDVGSPLDVSESGCD
jgi:hypothetical protein